MSHPLVEQLRFARSEFVRGLENLDDEDARRRLQPMNCISWIVGHLAWQEQMYWLTRAQGQVLIPELNEMCANGAPQSTPKLDDMWQAWHTVTQAAEPYLTSQTLETLTTFMNINGKPARESVGTMMLRMTYRDNGQLIHFEGTYTNDFSGNPEKTPRYNYNQMLYRLDLTSAALKGARVE